MGLDRLVFGRLVAVRPATMGLPSASRDRSRPTNAAPTVGRMADPGRSTQDAQRTLMLREDAGADLPA